MNTRATKFPMFSTIHLILADTADTQSTIKHENLIWNIMVMTCFSYLVSKSCLLTPSLFLVLNCDNFKFKSDAYLLFIYYLFKDKTKTCILTHVITRTQQISYFFWKKEVLEIMIIIWNDISVSFNIATFQSYNPFPAFHQSTDMLWIYVKCIKKFCYIEINNM